MPLVKWVIWVGVAVILWLFLSRLVGIWKQKRYERNLRKSGMHDIDRMDEYEFGTFVKLLFKEVGFTSHEVKEEELLFGADFLLDGETKAVLQIQLLGPNTRLGVKAVQEIHAARTYHEAEEAWIITNTVFTENARWLAKACKVKLIDRFLLQKLIKTVNPEVDSKEVRESIRLLFEEAAWEKIELKQKREGKFMLAEETEPAER